MKLALLWVICVSIFSTLTKEFMSASEIGDSCVGTYLRMSQKICGADGYICTTLLECCNPNGSQHLGASCKAIFCGECRSESVNLSFTLDNTVHAKKDRTNNVTGQESVPSVKTDVTPFVVTIVSLVIVILAVIIFSVWIHWKQRRKRNTLHATSSMPVRTVHVLLRRETSAVEHGEDCELNEAIENNWSVFMDNVYDYIVPNNVYREGEGQMSLY